MVAFWCRTKMRPSQSDRYIKGPLRMEGRESSSRLEGRPPVAPAHRRPRGGRGAAGGGQGRCPAHLHQLDAIFDGFLPPARPTSSRPTLLACLEPRYKILTSSSRSSTARRPSGSARSARVPPRPPCLFRGMREARARESGGCRVRCRRAMQGARDRLVRARCIDRQRLRRLWTCRAGATDASVARALRAGAGTRARASDHVCRACTSREINLEDAGATRGSA